MRPIFHAMQHRVFLGKSFAVQESMAQLWDVHYVITHLGHEMSFIQLHQVNGAQYLPILIGRCEAWAIHQLLVGASTSAQPSLHHSFLEGIRLAGGCLEAVRITDFNKEKRQYLASYIIRQNGESLNVRIRPSDAIALAIASDAPVLVNNNVIQAAAESNN